jgi:hypothetical protein
MVADTTYWVVTCGETVIEEKVEEPVSEDKAE